MPIRFLLSLDLHARVCNEAFPADCTGNAAEKIPPFARFVIELMVTLEGMRLMDDDLLYFMYAS